MQERCERSRVSKLRCGVFKMRLMTGPRVARSRYELKCHPSHSENIISSESLRGYVAPAMQRCHVNRSEDDTSSKRRKGSRGQALVFLLKTSYQLKTGGLVYRPGHRV